MKSTCLQWFGVQSFRLSFWQPSSQRFLAMPASWGVADFKHELDSMHMLLQARPNLQPLKLQLKNQLLHKLDFINNLQAHDFLELYKVLEASSLPKDVLKDLTELVDAKALGAQSTGNTKVVSVAQTCDSLPLYLTDEDIKALAAVDMWKGIPILVSRLKALGVRSCKESTKKVVVALLVYFDQQRGGRPPSGDATYVLSQDFVAAMEKEDPLVPAGAASLAVYPANPRGLAKAHLQASYGQTQPKLAEFPGLNVIMKNHSWVRSTAKAVSHKKGAPKNQPLESQPPQAQGFQPLEQMFGAFTTAMQTAMCQAVQVASQGRAAAQLHLEFPKGDVKQAGAATGAGAAVLALEDGPAATGPEKSSQQLQSNDLHQDESKKPGGMTLEDFEKENMARLQARQAANAKVVKGKEPKAKAGGLKRPAAAAAAKSSETSKKVCKLGCRKCRGAVGGCTQCRNPAYKGQRLSRDEWLKVAAKEGLK